MDSGLSFCFAFVCWRFIYHVVWNWVGSALLSGNPKIRNREPERNHNRESINQRKQVLQMQCMWKITVRTSTFIVRALESKGLFKWRKGALPNLATWLEGLIHSLPLYATYLTGTVSGLLELSFESPLSTTNKNGRPKKLFSSYFSFPHRYRPVLCLKLVYYIVLFRLTVILFGR